MSTCFSKVARNAIVVPSDINVEFNSLGLVAKNSKSSMAVKYNTEIIDCIYQNGSIDFVFKGDDISIIRKNKAIIGTLYATLRNVILHLVSQYKISLKFTGVGYRVSCNNKFVTMIVGLSHSVLVMLPDGVVASVEKDVLHITGYDEVLISTIASRIRSVRPPEKYNLTGIFVNNEKIMKKEKKK